jgi:hypothetical protein
MLIIIRAMLCSAIIISFAVGPKFIPYLPGTIIEDTINISYPITETPSKVFHPITGEISWVRINPETKYIEDSFNKELWTFSDRNNLLEN